MKEKQMINLLEDYIHASLPGVGNFSTNPSLEKKVSKTGKLLPFYGNTTVFLLDREAKTALKQLQEELYLAAGELLAERLESDTLHSVNALEFQDNTVWTTGNARTCAYGCTPTWSYNASSGVLTVSGFAQSIKCWLYGQGTSTTSTQTLNFTAYLVYTS